MNGFSAGSVLGRSFGIWMKNLVPFTVLSLIVFVPLFLYTFFAIHEGMSLQDLAVSGGIVAIGSMLLSFVATGAITYGTFQQLRGQPAGLGQCISVGLGRMFPILGVGLLMGLVVMLGFVLLIIPGIIAVCALFVAVPVAVVERPGVGAALSRSAALTKGSRGSIFGILFAVGVINGVVSRILQAIFDPQHAHSLNDIRMYMLAVVAISAVFSSLQAVSAAVAYHDLRASREGIAIDELARVFD